MKMLPVVSPNLHLQIKHRSNNFQKTSLGGQHLSKCVAKSMDKGNLNQPNKKRVITKKGELENPYANNENGTPDHKNDV